MLMRFTDQDNREVHFTAVPLTEGGTRLMMSFYRNDTKRAILNTCIDVSEQDATVLGTAINPAKPAKQASTVAGTIAERLTWKVNASVELEVLKHNITTFRNAAAEKRGLKVQIPMARLANWLRILEQIEKSVEHIEEKA